MIKFELERIQAEAKRMAYEHEWDFEQYEKHEAYLKQRSFTQAVEPLLRAKSELYMTRVPAIRINTKTHEITSTYEFSDSEKALFSQIDEMIADIAKQYGFTEASQ